MGCDGSGVPSTRISDLCTNPGEPGQDNDSSMLPASIHHRLVDLSHELYECASKLPSVNGTNSQDDSKSARTTTLFALDECFRLTRDFIHIMRCISSTQLEQTASLSSLDREPFVAQSTFSCSHPRLSNLSTTNISLGRDNQSTRVSVIDESTIFMLVSCHCRLAETYEWVFRMMQACVAHSLVPIRDRNWAIVLPKWQFGSFSSPEVLVGLNTPPLVQTTISMYMLMVATLSSDLWAQISSLLTIAYYNPDTVNGVSDFRLTDTVWQAVIARTHSLCRTIDAMQNQLTQ